MVSIGTNALLGYGRNIIRKVNPPAASGDLAIRPKQADSQEIARMNISRIPATASRSSGPASGRKPMRKATPKTSAVATVLRSTLAATWPARIGVPPMSSDRKRSTMPPVMSWVTVTAVLAEPKPAHSSITPGTT